MPNPRTKDTQPVPSRFARSHHSKQRGARFTINGHDHEKVFAEYVTTTFPDTPTAIRKNMVRICLYAIKHDKPVPTPNELNHLFEGDIVTPSEIPLNPRQNG